ncbi:MAG TPA: phosphotriesterase [Chryseolinea sp.]
MISRRSFLQSVTLLSATTSALAANKWAAQQRTIMTVTGPISADDLGTALIHEHILVDFIGAAQYNPQRWNDEDVIKKVLPFLKEVKNAGCKTIVDCTPNFLGRDVLLLQRLSKESELSIITNTGYYGGSDEKFLPLQAFTETSSELAARWIAEWENGIDGTGIKPGFMKISVNPGTLSKVSQKLVEAAAKTHLRSGLTIASHTGPAIAAFEEIEILKKQGVSPDAFIWVHAQSEKDPNQHLKAARMGTWVSLDGVSDSNIPQYVDSLTLLKKERALHRILLSHDAGWYEPGKPDGGNFRGYMSLFKQLIPALMEKGFTNKDIDQLLIENPKEAFTIKIKKL